MPTTAVPEIDLPTPADGQPLLTLASGIELFTADDVKVIEELWTEFATRGDLDSWYHFLVARWNGKITGFACYGRRPLTECAFDLYWIGVGDAHQGRGIGRALLKRVEFQVRTQGGKLLIVETEGRPTYEPTRQFYLASGYDLEGRIRDFYSPGNDLFIFTKHL
ncbi:MAG: GNAT family N-acetyltransferase [Anaerolineales bacterium]|nr:GNAT family N-acetyltransferase [Anaerolineales bacterium]